jgi:hypothetical protein
MADIAVFGISLEDMLTPSASKAKASVDKLSESLKSAKSELSGYKAQLSIAKDLGDVEGYRKYTALVDQSKSKIFGMAQQLEGAKSELGTGAVEAEGFAEALGPIGAAAAVAVAGLAALVSVLKFGVITALDEANEKARYLAGFDALGGKGAGEKTMAMLDELGGKLPQSEEQLVKWTKQLQAMGITDLSKIRSELIATASAQAVMGDEGAAAYTKIQERVRLAVEAHHGLKLAEKSLKALYSAGINMTDVAKRMGMSTQDLSAKLKAGTIDAQKFGDVLSASVTEKGKGPLDVMMNSLGAMGKRFHKLFGDLFEDVDTKPLTDALRNVISLLDKGQPSGEAMGKGITGAMNMVIRVLGHAITEGEIFFLTMEVKALQAYIALKPLIGAVEKIGNAMGALGFGKNMGGSGKVEPAMSPDVNSETAGRQAGQLAKDGFLGAATGIPFVFFDVLTSIGDAKAQEIARQGGVNVGKATIEGIRAGVDAHSPSVEAIKIGMDLGAGLGMGMEASPAPERAARTISGNALGGLAGKPGFGGSPANDTGGTTIGPFEINITAPEGVTDAHTLSVVGLSTALERFQIGSGR